MYGRNMFERDEVDERDFSDGDEKFHQVVYYAYTTWERGKVLVRLNLDKTPMVMG